MANLTHITKCLLCHPDNPFRIEAREFEAIPRLGEPPDQRLQMFFMALERHIQEKADRESKRIDQLQKQAGTNGKVFDINGSAQAAAQLMVEHGRHLTQASGVPVFMNLARAFMVASAFETSDPKLTSIREEGRAHLHRATRKNNLTDETIQSHVAQLGLDQVDADAVFGLLKEMRDILTESGDYAPGGPGTDLARSSILIPGR